MPARIAGRATRCRPRRWASAGATFRARIAARPWLAEAPAFDIEDDRLFTPSEEEALDKQFTDVEKRGELATVPSALRKLMPLDQTPPPEVGEIDRRDQGGAGAAGRAAWTSRRLLLRKAELRPRPPRRPGRSAGCAAGAALSAGADAVRCCCSLPWWRAGLMFRTEIVRVLPDMAGVYAAVGMPVNVVGLEFSDVIDADDAARRRGRRCW